MAADELAKSTSIAQNSAQASPTNIDDLLQPLPELLLPGKSELCEEGGKIAKTPRSKESAFQLSSLGQQLLSGTLQRC